MTSVSSFTKWGRTQWEDICCPANECSQQTHPIHPQRKGAVTVRGNIRGMDQPNRGRIEFFPRGIFLRRYRLQKHLEQWEKAKEISIREENRKRLGWKEGEANKEQGKVEQREGHNSYIIVEKPLPL